MASPRKSKPFTPDAQSTRFLYLIIKQLDLKAVNWQEVADNIGIKNGHAARMRWSRFKQHAEGTPPQPKTPKPKKTDAEKNGKRDSEHPGDLMMADDDRNEKRVKLEHGLPMPHGYSSYTGFPLPPYPMPAPMPVPMAMPALPPPMVKTEPSVKPEPGVEVSQRPGVPPGLLCEPPQRQPQHLPSTNTTPSPTFSTPFAPNDGDTDDIPIKLLLNSHNATVSMAELQLSSPVKQKPDTLVQSSPPIGRAGGSSTVEASERDSQKPPPAPALPATLPVQQSETPQSDVQKALPVDQDFRRPTPTSPANHRELTAMPAQAPTWFPSSPGAFQPMGPAYYPAFPPGSRPPQYPQLYLTPYGHQQPHPMSYMQRPMMHPFNYMGYPPHPPAPFSQHPLLQSHMPMQSTYPSMPYSRPQDASPPTEDRPGTSTSSHTPRDQAEQGLQGATQMEQEEKPATCSPEELQAERETPSQEHRDLHEMTKGDSTLLPETRKAAMREHELPIHAQSSLRSEVHDPTSLASTASGSVPVRPTSAPPELAETSCIPTSQTQAATQFRAGPLTSSPAAAVAGRGGVDPPCQPPTHAPAPWWPPLHPTAMFAPPATFPHLPQTAHIARSCGPNHVNPTQTASPDAHAPSVDDLGFDFDFDFSAIQDDLRSPFQEQEQAVGPLPMEPQFLVAEERASSEPQKTDIVGKEGLGGED